MSMANDAEGLYSHKLGRMLTSNDNNCLWAIDARTKTVTIFNGAKYIKAGRRPLMRPYGW